MYLLKSIEFHVSIEIYPLAKYVRLYRKDRLTNMVGTTLYVAMLADVSEAHSAILNVYECVTGPLRHRHSYLTLIGQQNVNGAALES